MSGEWGAIAVPALRPFLRRSIVAHFARKVRATITKRECFKFAIGPCFKSAIIFVPSLCEQSELQCFAPFCVLEIRKFV